MNLVLHVPSYSMDRVIFSRLTVLGGVGRLCDTRGNR